MDYLEKYNFTKDDISSFINNVPASVVNLLEEQKKQVSNNIKYLRELGVENYKDVFLNYYEIFLNDDTIFRAIFDKYDRDDLIDKIAKNINIVEYL
jgi:hypothetical protein